MFSTEKLNVALKFMMNSRNMEKKSNFKILKVMKSIDSSP